MLSKSQKNIALILLALLLVVVVMFVYRVFFEFNNKKVRSYIQQEANKYPDPVAAYKVINDAVMFVLTDRNLTSQVREIAAEAKMDKERILVDSAINQCKAFGYILETRYQFS